MRSAIHWVVSAVFLTVQIAPAAARPAARPITKMDVYKLPESVVQQRVFNQLMRNLQTFPAGEGDPDPGPPRSRLDEMIFATMPRATNAPGLCAYNDIIVSFDPVSKGRSDARTPVVASGARTQNRFAFQAEPTEPVIFSLEDDQRFDRNSGCAAMEPEKFFLGDSEEEVAKGANRFREVVREAKGGQLSFPCLDWGKATEKCRLDVAALQFRDISGIHGCDPVGDADQCSYLTFQGASLKIYWRVASSKATRVELSPLVTLGHSRPW